MRAEDLPPLSEAQLEIMSVVWDHDHCTVADVLHSLRENREVSRNTVHTMMSRLVDKGWLEMNGEAPPFTYQASVPRSTVQQDCVNRMLDNVFAGSAEGLLLSLLHNRSLSREEAARIRKMIRQAEERS